MSEETTQDPVIIKKYANRRLYNTASSSYLTLDDLAVMVKEGTDFVVRDAKTGEDITRSVLTQIIFDEENKGQNLLPINFLRQLIRLYGDSMQAFVPSYLDYSLRSLTQEQEKFRQQMMNLGGEPFQAIEEQTKRNMEMFQQAMQMFSPFAPANTTSASPSSSSTEPSDNTGDDLDALQSQISKMQQQLDALSKKKT